MCDFKKHSKYISINHVAYNFTPMYSHAKKLYLHIFDIIVTAFSYERYLIVYSFLQDFPKGKGSSLQLICNAQTAFLLRGSLLGNCKTQTYSNNGQATDFLLKFPLCTHNLKKKIKLDQSNQPKPISTCTNKSKGSMYSFLDFTLTFVLPKVVHSTKFIFILIYFHLFFFICNKNYIQSVISI